MSARLTLEIYGGSTINRACEEAQRIADMLGVDVQFVFNGVRCLAVPHGASSLLAERQQGVQARKLELPPGTKDVTSSTRDWVVLAAGAQSAETTEELAQSEGRQSGPKGNAHD